MPIEGDEWPRRRRRPRSFWDPFGLFDEFFEDTLIDEYLDRIMNDVEKLIEDAIKRKKGKNYVYGFSITIGPDGIPRIQTFGDKPRTAMRPLTEEEEEKIREPLVEINEDENKVYVTVELPGVDKDKIDLEVRGDELYIRAEGENRKYSKKLKLPAYVDPESIKATYKNGILDIIMDKKRESKEGKKIKID